MCCAGVDPRITATGIMRTGVSRFRCWPSIRNGCRHSTPTGATRSAARSGLFCSAICVRRSALGDNIISLQQAREAREAREPHIAGPARCMACRYEWDNVLLGDSMLEWLECPKCMLVRGRFIHPCVRGAVNWECNCGCDVFHLSESGFYCPNCGRHQSAP